MWKNQQKILISSKLYQLIKISSYNKIPTLLKPNHNKIAINRIINQTNTHLQIITTKRVIKIHQINIKSIDNYPLEKHLNSITKTLTWQKVLNLHYLY